MIRTLWLRRLFFAIPPLALAVQAIDWLCWGIDMPYWDDWRIFIERDAGSLAPADLFRPANDTLYVTGKVLDALAFRFLDYNSVAYQFLSMTLVLGALLAVQALLLRKTGLPSWFTAAAFAGGGVLMLQPGGYWGQQNVAYHQAIPPLLLLASIGVAVSARFGPVATVALVALFSVVGGLTYISGAFAVALAAGVSFAFAFTADAPAARKLRAGALGFAIGAALTVPLQLWVILIHQHGSIHRPDASWSFPWDWQFWAFLLGVVSHAFSVQRLAEDLRLPLGASLILTLATLMPAVSALRYLAYRRQQSLRDLLFPYAYLTLFLAVGFYLVMVAAGRTTLGEDPSGGWRNYFLRGSYRFHFFWVTVLIPWLIAYALMALQRRLKLFQRLAAQGLFATASVIVTVGGTALLGSVSYNEWFRFATSARSEGVACLQGKLAVGEAALCPTLYPGDLGDMLLYARQTGVSFVRPLIAKPVSQSPADSQSDDEDKGPQVWQPLWPNGGFPPPTAVNGTLLTAAAGAMTLDAAFDSRLLFQAPAAFADTLSRCRRLRVEADLDAPEGGYVQLFYTTPLNPGFFAEDHSIHADYTGGASSHISLEARATGFLPLIRLDPGNAAQRYGIRNLSIACR